MSRDDATRSLRYLDETLGPVLEAVGFAPAQISVPAPTAGSTYCAALATIRKDFPELPDGQAPEDAAGACFDVIVEATEDRLVRVQTDGGDLDENLEVIGMDEAADAYRRMVGQPMADIRDDLVPMIQSLFTSRDPDPNPPVSRRFLTLSWIFGAGDPSLDALQRRLSGTHADQHVVARAIYEYVRDEVRHSLDHGDTFVTLSASDVLRHGTGLCYAKSHLAAALFRRSGIPSGLAYQLLDSDDGPVLHGLVAIHMDGAWHRLDVRGNKPGVDAKFNLQQEQLAYHGEGVTDLPGIHAEPARSVQWALENATDLRQVRLPSSL